jgi:dipeptidyl aminopeptidase/acylaminoacyl peptidase
MDFTKRGGLDPASLKPGELATIAAVAVTTFLGCLPSACPEKAAEASPVTHVDKTDAPMLVVNSTNELVPESQAEAIAAALDKAGVVYQKVIVPGSKHASALTDDVWDQSVAFFERYLGKPKP